MRRESSRSVAETNKPTKLGDSSRNEANVSLPLMYDRDVVPYGGGGGWAIN